MTLRRFVSFSIALHVLILAAIYKIPPTQQKKQEKQFTTTLVSPDVVRPPAPPLPPVTPPRERPAVPMPRNVLPEPRSPRTPEFPAVKPLIPGEGGGPPGSVTDLKGTGQEGAGSGRTGKGPSARGRDERPGLLGREGLFDRGVTEEIARRSEGAGRGRGGKDDAITLDTREYRFMGYNRLLRSKIESIWVYPPEALARGIYGDLKIRFTIKKDGRLGAVELVRTSGYKMLDDAAIQALKNGEPYWPLPAEWGMDSYTILGHFIYSMYGAYVR